MLAGLLWTMFLGGTAQGLGISYTLLAYNNDNMSAQEYIDANGLIVDNGYWRPAPTSVWFRGDGTLVVLSARDYTVNFLRIRGFYVPASVLTNVSNDGYSTLYYQIYSNSLSVTVAGLAGGGVGRWQLSAPAEYTNTYAYAQYSGTGYTNNNVIISNIPVGSYTITFSDTNGYTAPSAVTTWPRP